MMATQEVIHAYRHLYRGLLHAVRFSAPARYIARDQLRRAFREPVTISTSATSTTTRSPVLDPEAVKRTIWFLQAAAKDRGLEHKVLKNLLKVAMFRHGKWVSRRKTWRTVQLELSQGKPQDGQEK